MLFYNNILYLIYNIVVRITKMTKKYSPKHNKIDVQFINSNVY